MTCIVGLAEGERVWMGGDAATTNGWDLQVLASPKVFRNGPLLIGGTGEIRITQVLRYALKPPAHPDGIAVEEYLSTAFVDATREAFKQAGYAKKDNEQEAHNGALLVAYRGVVATLDSRYGVSVAAGGYDAVGCGSSFALGVLYATDGLPGKHRVRLALEAAERFSAGVRGPFTIECLESVAATATVAAA